MTERPISPVAAQKGEPVKASVGRRCSCTVKAGAKDVNPTCPVHGYGLNTRGHER